MLGNMPPLQVLPFSVKQVIEQVDYYLVENEKSARSFIKKICPEKLQGRLYLSILHKDTPFSESIRFLDSYLRGGDVGIISEAGCPAIADPGAAVVQWAHQKNIRVVPLVGPSSILLALMASGMNGQCFAFNGYLPIADDARKNAIRALEKRSRDLHQSQIFMETPYRNEKLFADLKNTLYPDTLLCVACDITLPTEYIRTLAVKTWKSTAVTLHKRPCIFIIQAC